MLKRVIGNACRNRACAKKDVLVPSDLHVCDACAEPLSPVKKWNRGLIAALCLVMVACGAAAAYFGRRAPTVQPPPSPPPPQEITLAFALEMQGYDGTSAPVPPDHSFHSGDRFRVVLKPDFDAYISCDASRMNTWDSRRAAGA